MGNRFTYEKNKTIRRILTPVLIFALVICGLSIPKSVNAAANYITLKVRFSFQWGSNSSQSYYYAGEKYAATVEREIQIPDSTFPTDDANANGGSYYTFTISADYLDDYPVYREQDSSLQNASSETKYATAFRLSENASGMYTQGEQTVNLRSGNQELRIGSAFFTEQNDHEYTVTLNVNDIGTNVSHFFCDQNANGSTGPVFGLKEFRYVNGAAYGVYEVNIPSESSWTSDYNYPEAYNSGIVKTAINLESSLVNNKNIRFETEDGEVTSEIFPENDYYMLIPEGEMYSLNSWLTIESKPVICLPVTYDPGEHGEVDEDYNRTYTASTVNPDGNWEIPIDIPSIDNVDTDLGYYEFGWSVVTQLPLGVTVQKDENTGNYIATIPNTFATDSANASFALTFNANYGRFNGTYSISAGDHIASGETAPTPETLIAETTDDSFQVEFYLRNINPEQGWEHVGYKITGIPDGLQFKDADTEAVINNNDVVASGSNIVRIKNTTAGNYDVSFNTVTFTAEYERASLTLFLDFDGNATTSGSGDNGINLRCVDYDEDEGMYYFEGTILSYTLADNYLLTGWKNIADDCKISADGNNYADTNETIEGAKSGETIYVAVPESKYANWQGTEEIQAQYITYPQVYITFNNGSAGSFTSAPTSMSFKATDYEVNSTGYYYIGNVVFPSISASQGKVFLGYKYSQGTAVLNIDDTGRVVSDIPTFEAGQHSISITSTSLSSNQVNQITFTAFYADEGFPITVSYDGVDDGIVYSEGTRTEGGYTYYIYTVDVSGNHRVAALEEFDQGWRIDNSDYINAVFSDDSEYNDGQTVILDNDRIKCYIKDSVYAGGMSYGQKVLFETVNDVIVDSGTYTLSDNNPSVTTRFFLGSGTWTIGNDGYTYTVPHGVRIYAPYGEPYAFTKQ